MPTSIRLDAETERRLGDIARLTGRTKAWHIRQAVKTFLEDWEDHVIALSRLETEQGEIDISEVRRRIDLAD